MKHRIDFALAFSVLALSLAGCSSAWKLGPQEQEVIKQTANTGQVIGDLSGVPGGGQLGALIGTAVGTIGAGIGLYKHGKDKGWDDAAGKPGTPGAAKPSIVSEVKA
jgi:hypothetical protein